jgi:hypothetical protein
MTIYIKELRLRSGFTYDDSSTEIRLSLPITPWIPSARSIGGDIESDAGVRSSFIICQRETLGLTLRFYENQWKDIQAWINTVQDGMPFTWTPDPTYRNYPEYDDVVLESPLIGSKYEATPDPDFPRVLRLPIILGRVGCTLFNMKEIPPPPQFAAFGPGDGLLHVTQVNGTVSLIMTAVGGGAGGNGSGGGGGGASWGTRDARVGTIFIHVGEGGAPGFPGEDSNINYPVAGGGSDNLGAGGGNAPFGAVAGGSGASHRPGEDVSYPGGGGAGVGFAGSVGPPPLPAFGASAGGGGGGAGGAGHDAHASAFGGSGTATGGDGGSPGATLHGAHGGGGGGGSAATGAGSASDGGDGGGGAGRGGHGNGAGGMGMVVVEWQLGEIVATQEI